MSVDDKNQNNSEFSVADLNELVIWLSLALLNEDFDTFDRCIKQNESFLTSDELEYIKFARNKLELELAMLDRAVSTVH